MRVAVTGSAGFIGSRLCSRLLADGHDVVGIDRRNHADDDLVTMDLSAALAGADAVLHLAARPGVRSSWEAFDACARDNVVATQLLLDAVRVVPGIDRVVVASSSSVYGEVAPGDEDAPLAPVSPYGVTKVAVEQLCRAYVSSWGTPVVILRPFTVYGPGQRADMAVHRMCEAAFGGDPFPLYGNGSAARDLTYVDDVVDAFVRAMTADVPAGTTVDVAGGHVVSVHELLTRVGELAGREVPLVRRPAQPGEARRTQGSTRRAAALLGWRPVTPLDDGLTAQVDWHRAAAAARERQRVAVA